ncbi:MAG: hypothetical protein AAFO04_01380 [Cyanobacteria bacterium J06592_8]
MKYNPFHLGNHRCWNRLVIMMMISIVTAIIITHPVINTITDLDLAKTVSLNSSMNFDNSWSFKLDNYTIEHQGIGVIDLTVTYDYRDDLMPDHPWQYLEIQQVYNYIHEYLTNYPNETDFWEILNKNLVLSLLNQPISTVSGLESNLSEVVDMLTVEINVLPGSSDILIPRTTIVLGSPTPEGIVLNESWMFTLEDYPVEHQGDATIDLTVSYDYVDATDNNQLQYPEFMQIYNYIASFIRHYPNETDSWEVLNENLVMELLTQTIPNVFGSEYRLAEILDSVSVTIDIMYGSSKTSTSHSISVNGRPTV